MRFGEKSRVDQITIAVSEQNMEALKSDRDTRNTVVDFAGHRRRAPLWRFHVSGTPGGRLQSARGISPLRIASCLRCPPFEETRRWRRF
ncbi:hypothetical protein L596_029406 [Steinernema carpocapsae]|uniref:Uncharacterized protein n=1 Tax=Steinernema carpocapsae TaxID=34508 RepID=A0A4U5LUJ5_STECR|nr:hypothetical protein L596_029406 [Steinernema carpocapsae]